MEPTLWGTQLPPLPRLDWRFLLPDPDPRRWAFLGSAETSLGRALRAGTQTSPNGPSMSDGPFDLVIAAHSDEPTLAGARRLLHPSGVLLLELGGPSGRPLRMPAGPRIRRRLRSYGFDDLTLAWPWPDHERPTRFMPLQRRGPRIALERTGDAPAARLLSRAASTLGSVGLLAAVVPSVTVVARRSGPGHVPAPGLAGTLLTERARWGLEPLRLPIRIGDLDWVLLTPRFRSSRHLILLAGPAGGDPSFAAKLARVPDDGDQLRHASETLVALHAHAGPHLRAVPRCLGHDTWAGRPLLVESAMTGRALSPDFARQDPRRYGRATMEWLLELPRSGPPGAVARPDIRQDRIAEDWVTALIDPPLTALETGGVSSVLGQLIGRTREALATGRSLPVPRVFEHGDLAHPNLLWSDERGLGVIDWELGRPDGLPLHDLTFCLTYLAGAEHRARTPDEHGDAFEAAFLSPDGWARPLLAEYARRAYLPQGAVAPLVVATWARLLALLPQRTGGAAADSAAAGVGWSRGGEALSAVDLGQHRFARILERALTGWDRLARIQDVS